PPEELPVYLALKHGRTTMRDDIVVHRPDGRKVPLVTWAAPVHLGARQSPEAAVWVLEDLTALHQSEASRKETETRLRTVIETMAEGLLVHDTKGAVVSCNPAACSFFGTQPDQIQRRSLADLDWVFLREDTSEMPAEEHPSQVALRTGRPVRHVVVGVARRRKDEGRRMKDESATSDPSSFALPPSSFSPQEVRWILVNAMPLGPGAKVPAQGEAQVVVTTFSDISAYVHAREGIRISEERYRGLIESLPMMLLQLDRNLRIIYANPAMTLITGY